MNSRIRMVFPLIASVVFGFSAAGCNIFDFASDVEKPKTEQAEDMIREGDYQGARDILAADVKDSTDSYALYLDAKAALYEGGVDIVEIANLIEGQNAVTGQELGLLQIIDNLSDEQKTAWYKANLTVSANLRKIFNQQTTGPFEPSDVALEYTVSNLMSAMLGLRDTNRDGIINNNDFTIDLSFINSKGSEGYSFSGGTFEDSSGNTHTFKGLEVFLGSGAAHKAAVEPGKEGYEPDDINNLIVFVMDVLQNSREALIVLLQKNVSAFNPEDIDGYLTQITSLINFYWYDDGEDTDGDGRIDEETINGLDDDGDGLIDEDTGYAGYPTDPTNTRNTQYHSIWLEWKNK